MKCHQTEQSTDGRSAAGYTYPKGRLLPSCLGLRNFAGFHSAKTSANKRFLYYVCKLFVCGCKGTTKFADVQIFGLKKF